MSTPDATAGTTAAAGAKLRSSARVDGHPTNPGGLSGPEFVDRRDAQWARVARVAAKHGYTNEEIFVLGVQFAMDAYKLFAGADGASAAEVDALGASYRQRIRGTGGGGAGGATGGGAAGGASGG